MDPTAKPAEPTGHSLDDLLTRTLPQLRCFVQRRLGRRLAARETVSDLVQSACRQAITEAGAAPTDSSSLRQRLFRIAHHKIIDRSRHHAAAARTMDREDGEPPSGDPVAADPSPLAIASLRDDAARVERVLATLPPADRDVIVLAVVLGLPHTEIARHLDTTPTATRSRLSRALAKLALRLAPHADATHADRSQ